MSFHTQLCFVFFGVFSITLFLHNESRMIGGYEFPVYSTVVCPRNQTEWKERSSAINCTEENGYLCLPNENISQLLEFCYIYPFIWMQEGVCLYLYKRFSKVNAHNCQQFRSGCPTSSYMSSKSFEHPSCTLIGNGCFLDDPSCESSTTKYHIESTEHTQNVTINSKNESSTKQPENTTKTKDYSNNNNTTDVVLIVTIIGISITICIICLLCIYKRRRNLICKRNIDRENHEYDEFIPLIPKNEEESPLDQDTFRRWQEDNKLFIRTKACKKVEKLTKRQNLVMVVGHSGSGKSAIIQHIALKYRSQGWIVKPMNEVTEIIRAYSLKQVSENKTLFILNDPIGKESFDEIAYDSWKKHEVHLEDILMKMKLLLSCRRCVWNDNRAKGLLKDKTNIVHMSKLNEADKLKILNIHTSNMKIAEDDLEEILQIEAYFPLLCKLFSNDEKKKKDALRFFKEPSRVLEEEIRRFRETYKEKYCALVLLVLFNNVVCMDDIMENVILKEKFKHAMELCGMNLAPYKIVDTLKTLNGSFVKNIGDNYHFYHDFVMEVTTYVFGTDYPLETIRYADIGFLRRRVKLKESYDEKNDEFTIYLSHKHVQELGKRLFTEIFGERLFDVVLNPCLKNANVAEILKEQLNHHPEKIKSLLEKKEFQFEKQETNKRSYRSNSFKLRFVDNENEKSPFSANAQIKKIKHNSEKLKMLLQDLKIEQDKTSNNLILSKFAFIGLESKISPIGALIVFCHTHLSIHYIKTIQQLPSSCIDKSLFAAVCCNGAVDLFQTFIKDHEVDKLFFEKWGIFHPIHIVSMFHNHEILRELIKYGVDVNSTTDDEDGWTPLMLAAGNDTEEKKRRAENLNTSGPYITLDLLLSHGANINQCNKNGTSTLYIACQNGHESIVQLLLNYGADVNLCNKNGASSLYIACQNGHESTVKLLLSSGANIDFCNRNGTSALYIASQNGHEDIAHLLLKNGANVNLCDVDTHSLLFIALLNGHMDTAQFLLTNGADINLHNVYGFGPLHIACFNGLDSVARLALCNATGVNYRGDHGFSPLFLACKYGYDGIVQLLLSEGADINLCNKEKESPLFIACLNGHESIVQFLLSNGADISLPDEDGDTPLLVACCINHDSIVKILLNTGADINSRNKNGENSLIKACQNGSDSIANILISNGANINLCDMQGYSPLLHACMKNMWLGCMLSVNICSNNEYSHYTTILTLVKNGADVNLCSAYGTSPLHEACEQGCEMVADLFLKNGANINVCDKKGVSSLHNACVWGCDTIVQLLLNYGASINICDNEGLSPLHKACERGCDSTVQLLLNNGAKINSWDREVASPLHIACVNGNNSTVQLLLNNNADIDCRKKDGTSPLDEACRCGQYSTVPLLLSNDADINSCETGFSPLHIASAKGIDSIVKLLLSNGADIDLCMEDGFCSLLLACVFGHDSTAHILLNNGADSKISIENISPLYIAFAWRLSNTIATLLENGADKSIVSGCGLSSAYFDHNDKDDKTMQFLLDADNIINNLHDPDSFFSLFVFCQVEQMKKTLFF